MRKLYTCKVRLGGSILNEVRMENVTAAEIQLLRVLHGSGDGGNDPVVDIVHTGKVNRTDATERARLAGIYSKTDPSGPLSGPALVQKYFGVNGVPLPNDVPAWDTGAEDDGEPEVVQNLSDEEIVPVEPEKVELPVAARTRRVRNPNPGFEQLTA